jgi:hypothetical protein
MPFSRTGILGSGGGAGDVVGPGVSVDLDIALFDGITGKLIKDSAAKTTDFAPVAKGVTNGDAHDHNGGDGAQINHTTLSNIGTKTHAQIDAALGYSLHFGQISGQTPVDAATYYFSHSRWTGQGTGMIFCAKAGTIKAIYGIFTQAVGTNEASTLSILKNGVDNTVVSNTLAHNAATTPFSKVDLNIAVNAGDYLELKWICPIWVTNPTGVVLSADAWVET